MSFLRKKYDVISIGDCTLDSFIELKEAEIIHKRGEIMPLLCMRYGDKIPYESLTITSAGNANNIAVGMARLGFKTGYYGSVGADASGHVILNALKRERVSTDLMSIQKGKQTNSHYVLSYHGDRTILIKHEAFNYELPKHLDDAKWIYFTHAGEKGLSLHAPFVRFLEAHPKIKMAFNPGTYQLRLGLKKLIPLFRHTEILCLNKEEAEELIGKRESIHALANALHSHGAHIIVITDGLKGSYCLKDGILYTIGIYPHHPIESTGAGDAYATAFTAACMYDLPVTEALRWGARNGASVATKIGPQAGLVTKEQMHKDLSKHKDFQAKIMRKK